MATVRLTESINDCILGNARALFTKRMSEANTYPPEYNDGDFIFDTYLDGNSDQRRVLMDMAALKWARRVPEIRVNLFGSNTTLRFKVPRTVYVGWGEPHYGERLHITVNNAPGLRDLHDKLLLRAGNIKSLEMERDQFVEKVKAILHKCSTLKQALGIWPGLWELVPQDVKNKHNEVTVRIKNAAPETPIDIDIDAMNGTVVVAKIVEGVI